MVAKGSPKYFNDIQRHTNHRAQVKCILRSTSNQSNRSRKKPSSLVKTTTNQIKNSVLAKLIPSQALPGTAQSSQDNDLNNQQQPVSNFRNTNANMSGKLLAAQ